MNEVVGIIYNSELSNAIRVAGWAIPAIQTVHILAIAGLLCSAIFLNLRLIGWLGNHEDTLPMVARFQAPLWGSMLVLLISGSALLWAEPDRVLPNQSFWIKMGLLVFSIGLAITIRRRLMNRAEESMCPSPRDYLMGASALALWASIIVYGRWIAYTY